MGKTIKLSNENYLDTSSIIHNSEILKTCINEIKNVLDSMKINNINAWFNVAVAEGSGLRLTIPIFNPKGTSVTGNFTSCRVFTNSAWIDIPISKIVLDQHCKTFVVVYIYASEYVSISNNSNYLVNLVGTITCQ